MIFIFAYLAQQNKGDILNEAQAEGYETIIMGRRELGKAKALLPGSVTRKVADNSKGCTVTIVS